jgi:hypothetical protein
MFLSCYSLKLYFFRKTENIVPCMIVLGFQWSKLLQKEIILNPGDFFSLTKWTTISRILNSEPIKCHILRISLKSVWRKYQPVKRTCPSCNINYFRRISKICKSIFFESSGAKGQEMERKVRCWAQGDIGRSVL